MPLPSWLSRNGNGNPLQPLHAATVATMVSDDIRAIVFHPNTDTVILQTAVNESYNVLFFQSTLETKKGTVYSRGVMIMPSIAAIASIETVIAAVKAKSSRNDAVFAELDQWVIDTSGRAATSSDFVKYRPSLIALTEIMRRTVAEWIARSRA